MDTGKPNFSEGAGVVCSLASLAARERVVPLSEEEEVEVEYPERSRKSVTRKYFPGDDDSAPWPWDRGQKEGTAAWIAFREVCSPGFMEGLVCER